MHKVQTQIQTILGIASIEGLDIQEIFIPDEGKIRIDVLVYGTGLDYDPTFSGIGSALIEIGPGFVSPTVTPTPADPTPADPTPADPTPADPTPAESLIPDWIKSNAAWWAEGEIDDDSFIAGIQYLIKEEILKIPETNTRH